MFARLASCAILLTTLTAAVSPALAADACDAGSPAAKQLTFDPDDSDTRAGLGTALRFGLSPETFPAKEIKENPRACLRGTLQAGRVTFTLLGESSILPERWAEDPGVTDMVVLLASLPKPQAALAWMKRAKDGDTSGSSALGDMMYVLVLTDGSKRYLHAFFDTMPDDATLARAMCGALTGQTPPVGMYGAATGESHFGSGLAKASDLGALKDCAWQAAAPH